MCIATTMCSSRRSIRACPSISWDINESAYSEQPFKDLQSTNSKHFPMVLFIKAVEGVLVFEFVDEILKRDLSNES